MQFLLNGFVMGAVYALVALGFSLIYRVTRFLDFAQAGILTTTAYLAHTFLRAWALPLWAAFLFSCALAVLLGCFLDTMIYRFIRRTRDSTAALFLASLGIYITLQNSISLIWGDNTRTLRTAVVIERYELLGARVSSVQLAILASAGALVTVVVLVMKTPFGRDLRALANDPNLAAIRGLNSNRLVTGAVALASFLTGSAAILLYIEVDLTPSGGFKLLIMGMIAAILGGLRSFGGCVIGGTLLGLAQNVAVFFLPAKWQDAVAFLILVICLLLRPQGILGGVLRLPQHVRAE